MRNLSKDELNEIGRVSKTCPSSQEMDYIIALSRKIAGKLIGTKLTSFWDFKEDLINDAIVYCLESYPRRDFAQDFTGWASTWIYYGIFKGVHHLVNTLDYRTTKFYQESDRALKIAEVDPTDTHYVSADEPRLTPVERWVVRHFLLGYTSQEIEEMSGMNHVGVWQIKKHAFHVLENWSNEVEVQVDLKDRWRRQRSNLLRKGFPFWEKDLKAPPLADRRTVALSRNSRNQTRGKNRFKGVSKSGIKTPGKEWVVQYTLASGGKKNGGYFSNQEDAATSYNFYTYHEFGPEAYTNTVPQPWLESI